MKRKYAKYLEKITVLLIPLITYFSDFSMFYLSLIFTLLAIYAVFNYRFLLVFIVYSLITLNQYVIIGTIMASIIVALTNLIKSRKLALISQLLLLGTLNVFFSFFLYEINIYKLVLNFLFICTIYIFVLFQIMNTSGYIKVKNQTMFTSLISILLICASINNPYGLLIITLYLLYLSTKSKEIPLMLGIFAFFLLHNPLYLIIAIISLLPYKLIFSLGFFLIDYLYIKQFSQLEIIITESSILIIEIYRLLCKEQPFDDNLMFNKIQNSFNEHILNFASFLDEFERLYVKNYQDRNTLSESFNIITSNICFKCPNKEQCFSQFREETYGFLRDALTYGIDVYYKGKNPSIKTYLKNCKEAKNIISLSNRLIKEYQINTEGIKKRNFLESQINGITTSLRQYAIDISLKNILTPKTLIDIKSTIESFGYGIILFELNSLSNDDFNIHIGISKGNKSSVLTNLKMAIESHIQKKIDIQIEKEFNDIIYIVVTPKRQFNVLYGGSSISKGSLDVRGDNYLFKTHNNRFICCLSDGMGSGKNAYIESNKTLNMVERILNLETNMETGVNMLNTFYSLKEETDSYATLDLLSFDLANGNALIYKMGSSNTYLIRGNEVSCLTNQNLPFGINDHIIKDEITLNINDFLVFMSDGVTDQVNIDCLKTIFNKIQGIHPQKAAFEIINSLSPGKISKDDMTALVIKIIAA